MYYYHNNRATADELCVAATAALRFASATEARGLGSEEGRGGIGSHHGCNVTEYSTEDTCDR